MPVPAFSDIAKPSNDLINKDFYHATAAALEVKLKADNAVSFTAKGTSAHEGATNASLEIKKGLNIKGATLTGAWNTANMTSEKIELDNVIADGLKVELLNAFSPAAGNKGQKANLYFKQAAFNGRLFADYTPTGAFSATVDGVFGHEGFLVGGEAGYDVQKAAITKYSAAVGYQTPQYSAAVQATNSLSIFTASYYQMVNAQVEAGAKAAWDAKTSGPVGIELGGKYKIDPESFAKGKINDRGIVSLAYNTKVKQGFTFGIGASFDSQKLNEAGHKIGTTFTFEG
ncbi:eukaryotic porin/Tom40 [Lineolata rhizophorae]|uniref:Eukaryotic porin/Tom40 n=1 Tax=Lineolata rhizophorae TaxID=578093 RepID=A0A6A6PBN4_9PEZI|nr:eukaryotic porin/Tom40 [Lineolata rhizophorae]